MPSDDAGASPALREDGDERRFLGLPLEQRRQLVESILRPVPPAALAAHPLLQRRPLLERGKWTHNRALRFDFDEVLSRREDAALKATAALMHQRVEGRHPQPGRVQRRHPHGQPVPPPEAGDGLLVRPVVLAHRKGARAAEPRRVPERSPMAKPSAPQGRRFSTRPLKPRVQRPSTRWHQKSALMAGDTPLLT